MLTVHLIDNCAAWNWETDGDPYGSTISLHTLACTRVGPIGTRTRWVWAAAEALRDYERATGTAPTTLRLCPLAVADLRGFKADLPGKWPNEATAALALHLHALLTSTVALTVEKAARADLIALVRNGERGIAYTLTARAGFGLGALSIASQG